MPEFDAVTQVPELRARFPAMKIVIMTAYESEFYAQALMAHVDGYLLKIERLDAFATAVQEVSKGRKYFTDRALDLAFNSPEVPRLSERELEVLKLAARGLKTAAIAQEMFISNRTVETHVQDACHKLGVRGRTAAVAKAIEIGLISAGAWEDCREVYTCRSGERERKSQVCVARRRLLSSCSPSSTPSPSRLRMRPLRFVPSWAGVLLEGLFYLAAVLALTWAFCRFLDRSSDPAVWAAKAQMAHVSGCGSGIGGRSDRPRLCRAVGSRLAQGRRFCVAGNRRRSSPRC